jgi:hypothetical protein
MLTLFRSAECRPIVRFTKCTPHVSTAKQVMRRTAREKVLRSDSAVGVHRRHQNDQHYSQEDHQGFEDRELWVRLVGAVRSLMDEHGRYFQEHFAAGKVLLFGPVMANGEAFGLGILDRSYRSCLKRGASFGIAPCGEMACSTGLERCGKSVLKDFPQRRQVSTGGNNRPDHYNYQIRPSATRLSRYITITYAL